MSSPETTIDTKPLRQAATSQPWPWSVHTNPLILAVLAYTLGIVTHTAALLLDLRTWHAAVGAAAIAAAAIIRAVSRHLHVSAIAYSITAAVLGATWITYATSTDTLNRDGALLAGAAGVLLLPWYVHLLNWRKRHAHGTVAEALADPSPDAATAAPVAPASDPGEVTRSLTALGVKGLTYVTTTTTPGGHRHDYRVAANGTMYADLLKLAPRLDIALRSPYRGAVRIEENPADVSLLHVFTAERDYLAEVHDYPEITTKTTIREPKRIAVYDDGLDACVPIWQKSGKIIGKRGEGKSSAAHVLISETTRCYDEIVIICDPKGAPLIGPWLAPYALGRTGKPILFAVASTTEEIKAVTSALIDIGKLRTSRLVSTDKVIPSAELPHYTLFIDEAHRVIGTAGDKDVRKNVGVIISQYRAAAEDVILLSQRATNSHVGSRDIRTQLDWTALLGVEDSAEVVAAIGRLRRGVDVTRFSQPGQMLLKTGGDSTRVAPARWLRLEESRIPGLAEAHTAWAPTPPAAELAIFERYGITAWWTTPGSTGYNVLSELRGEPVPELRAAAIAATSDSDDAPASILADIADVMTDIGAERMPSADIAAALAELDADRYGHLTKYTLATAVRGTGLKARQLGVGDDWDGNPRGYILEDVQVALAQGADTHEDALQPS